MYHFNQLGDKKTKMKKFTTLVLGLTAVCALTACGGGRGKEVSAKEFKAEAAKIEEHQYTSATLNYDITTKGKTVDEESIAAALLGGEIKTVDVDEHEKGTIEYKFEDGEWTTSSDDVHASQYLETLGESLKVMVETLPDEGVKGYKFFVGPFGVEATLTLEPMELYDGIKAGSSMATYSEFDKFGFVTKAEAKATTSMDFSASSNEKLAKLGTLESITNGNITVSYK